MTPPLLMLSVPLVPVRSRLFVISVRHAPWVLVYVTLPFVLRSSYRVPLVLLWLLRIVIPVAMRMRLVLLLCAIPRSSRFKIRWGPRLPRSSLRLMSMVRCPMSTTAMTHL